VSIAKEINEIFEKNKNKIERDSEKWIMALKNGENAFNLVKKEFHQWHPLRFYTSVTKAKSCKPEISVRFFGQEVASLIVEDKDVFLVLKNHNKKNRECFKCSLEDGKYAWRGKESKEFRKHFKEIKEPEIRIPEHRVESKFLMEMCEGSGKFNIKGFKIRPVLIACKFPLQVPVPISASTGNPKFSRGNIDILSRHKGRDNKDRLCLWELKGKGRYGRAASQVYIYAYTLLKILRHTKNGAGWYKVFGFNRNIPESLEIESVVAISQEQEKKFNEEKIRLERTECFKIGKDSIRLYIAFYEEEPNGIKFKNDPFC